MVSLINLKHSKVRFWSTDFCLYTYKSYVLIVFVDFDGPKKLHYQNAIKYKIVIWRRLE